jgi:hypothetical protein
MLPADFQMTVQPEGGENPLDSLVDTKFKNIGSLLNQDLLARWGATIDSLSIEKGRAVLYRHFVTILWGRVADPDSESGSGSRRAKMTHKSRKNFKSSCFEVLDGLFWELKASSITWKFFMEAMG